MLSKLLQVIYQFFRKLLSFRHLKVVGKENILLTKTLVLKGFQCPKMLYLSLYHPELAQDENTESKQLGTDIGLLAQRMFPDGIFITEKNPLKALEETQTKLSSATVFFEAAFKTNDNLYCRVDIFEKKGGKKIKVIEVKSSSKLEDDQYIDAAFQYHVLSSLGYEVEISLAYLNRNYTPNQPLKDLFIFEEVTERSKERMQDIKSRIDRLRLMITTLPDTDIGPHCSSPYPCSFKEHCFKEKQVPEVSVLNIPYCKHKWSLYQQGKVSLESLTEADMNTAGQKESLKKMKSKEPVVNKKALVEVLAKWELPLYLLDFETFSFAYPIYPNTKPYTDIPYQFSCFSIKDSTGLKKEMSYLAMSIEKDPRRDLALALIESIGENGVILAYNASFEKRIILSLADMFPDLRSKLLAIEARTEDLLKVVRDNVYFPEFNGSFSIKSVAPAMIGKDSSYETLRVKNGLEAQALFLTSAANGTVESVKDDLIRYCDKDVIEMANVLEKLREVSV